MPCSCHGKQGAVIDRRMPPDEPCTMCALKHIAMARSAWGEFSYEEDNRSWAANQVRLAIEHLKVEHRQVALTLRDIATDIELAKDEDTHIIAAKLADAEINVRALFQQDHPEVGRRLDELKIMAKMEDDADDLTDIIIPLGNGSEYDNDELRILLRSIERNAKGLKRVIIASQYCPQWVDREQVTVLEIADALKHNKDGNLEYKVLQAIQRCDVRRFTFCADDNVFVMPVTLSAIPKMHTGRGRQEGVSSNNWWARMARTFDFLASRGVDMPFDMESHAPQTFDGQRLLTAMNGVDYYQEGAGYNIMTLFRGVMGDTEAVFCGDYKETASTEEQGGKLRYDRLFLGYTDAGFAGCRRELFRMFNTKSKFEK